MKLVSQDHPALTTVCRPCQPEELPLLNKLKADAIRLMTSKQGVGLAATQVGDTRRWFVWKTGIVINPEILSAKEPYTAVEGCLSYPGIQAEVRRYKIITVKFIDYSGANVLKELTGLPAQIFQHELDHLNGHCSVAPDKASKPESAVRWQSCAQWPAGTIAGSSDNISTETHMTESTAKAVCRRLAAEGFAGCRCVFPLRTWVQPEPSFTGATI